MVKKNQSGIVIGLFAAPVLVQGQLELFWDHRGMGGIKAPQNPQQARLGKLLAGAILKLNERISVKEEEIATSEGDLSCVYSVSSTIPRASRRSFWGEFPWSSRVTQERDWARHQIGLG